MFSSPFNALGESGLSVQKKKPWINYSAQLSLFHQEKTLPHYVQQIQLYPCDHFNCRVCFPISQKNQDKTSSMHDTDSGQASHTRTSVQPLPTNVQICSKNPWQQPGICKCLELQCCFTSPTKFGFKTGCLSEMTGSVVFSRWFTRHFQPTPVNMLTSDLHSHLWCKILLWMQVG